MGDTPVASYFGKATGLTQLDQGTKQAGLTNPLDNIDWDIRHADPLGFSNNNKRNRPNDPKNPDNIKAGGTPPQLAAAAAAAAIVNNQNNAVANASSDQQAALLKQRQRGSLYQGMGATTLASGTPLGAGNFTGKTLLGS